MVVLAVVVAVNKLGKISEEEEMGGCCGGGGDEAEESCACKSERAEGADADAAVHDVCDDEASDEEDEEDDSYYSDDEENQEPDIIDLEDMGEAMRESSTKSSGSKKGPPKEMVTPKQAAALKKEGYKLIGTHSAVKLCRWTKHQLRGRGGCYKHTFYGITSYQCMEATPSPTSASFAGVITRIQSAENGDGRPTIPSTLSTRASRPTSK